MTVTTGHARRGQSLAELLMWSSELLQKRQRQAAPSFPGAGRVSYVQQLPSWGWLSTKGNARDRPQGREEQEQGTRPGIQPTSGEKAHLADLSQR